MRDSLRVLAISGVLAIAAALSPAIAQTEGPAPTDSASPAADSAQTASPAETASRAQPASPAQADGAAPPESSGSSAIVPDEDLKKALSEIRASWRDYEKCSGSRLCNDYFESFGVGITFDDGTLAPFAHVQRLKTSRHDCIMNARDALDRGDRSMAVQWVMASQMREPLERDWLGDHPDAVLAALRHAVL
jgi:hypothetical protein